MDLILDFICRMSIWELLAFGAAAVYALLWLPVLFGEAAEKYRRFREADREEYQPWMRKDKWNETR